MLQQPAPEDFVLATGETHPVREFVEKSFTEVGIELKFVYSNLKVVLLLNHASGGKDRERRNTRSTSRRGRASSKSTPDTSVPQKSSMSFLCVGRMNAADISILPGSCSATQRKQSAFSDGSGKWTLTLSFMRWCKLTSRLLVAWLRIRTEY